MRCIVVQYRDLKKLEYKGGLLYYDYGGALRNK